MQDSIDDHLSPYLEGTKSFNEYKHLTRTVTHLLGSVELCRSLHVEFLMKGLETLPSAFVSLDCNIPWLCYWILQSLDILGVPISATLAAR